MVSASKTHVPWVAHSDCHGSCCTLPLSTKFAQLCVDTRLRVRVNHWNVLRKRIGGNCGPTVCHLWAVITAVVAASSMLWWKMATTKKKKRAREPPARERKGSPAGRHQQRTADTAHHAKDTNGAPQQGADGRPGPERHPAGKDAHQ